VAIGLLAAVTSCHTKNVGIGGPQFLAATITVPANMFGLQDATWTANIQGGIGPFTVAWDFGGGANPNAPSFAAQVGPTSSATVNMINATAAPVHYKAKVTVTDSLGVVFTTPDPGVDYVVGIIQNQTPVVESATYAAGVLTVSVSDPDDAATLTVNVTAPAGFTIDAPSKVAASTGPLTATFNVGPTDILAGATGNFVVTVTDEHNATGTWPGGVDVTIAPLALAADTLYAIPASASAATGAPVKIIVATGVPANPFHYANSIGITMPSDGAYVAHSFHFGTGDDQSTVTGIWTLVGATDFIPVSDGLVSHTDLGGGSTRWDFGVSPQGGNDVTTASGVIMNVQFTYSAAGTKTLGFQQFLGVKRTYYSDSGAEYFWVDITNNHAGVPNSITVN
jgi:hypothetical protein